MPLADSTKHHAPYPQWNDSTATYRQPATPEQAIRLLPSTATPEQQDSVVQLYCKPKITLPPSTRPDTLGLPGLKANHLRQEAAPSYQDGFFARNEWLHPELKVHLPGIPGDPIPYTPRSDALITSALFVSLFLFSFVAAKSMRVFRLRIKDILHKKSREETVILSHEYELRSHTYVHLLNSLLAGILFFTYSRYFLPETSGMADPHKLILADIGIILCGYLIKGAAYRLVNWTFFSRQELGQWNNIRCLLAIVKTLCLFPLTLVAVYHELPLIPFLWILGAIFVVYEGLILLKSKQFFFNYKFGCVHLFLYFCTLEIGSLALTLRVLVYINVYYI